MQFYPTEKSLQLSEIAIPEPTDTQVQIKIHVCGICRTDLHVLDGELTHPKHPITPGHQIVGSITKLGSNVKTLQIGQRVGVPWLGWTCGECEFCLTERENLCDRAQFTGYQIDGGFAEYCVADARYCFVLPENYSDQEVASLLCAGLIGYRALRMTGSAKRIGIYGFGAAAHIVTQVALYQGREIYAFTRTGNIPAQQFALSLGAKWVGDVDQSAQILPTTKLDAAIIFAPVGSLVPKALGMLKKGGVVVCAGIHMSDIPNFSYDLLWGERSVISVANLTRRDGEEFLILASQIPIKTEVHIYPLARTNAALDDLRAGNFTGAGVIDMQ